MKTRRVSGLSVAVLIGAAVLVGAGTASAAPSPTCIAYAPAGVAGPTISDATPSPGQTITVTSGDCQFDAGTDVPTTFGHTGAGSATNVGTPVASPQGGATVTYTLPCDTPLGPASFDFNGGLEGQPNTVDVPLNVVAGALCGGGGGAAEAPTPKPPVVALPFTGSNVLVPGAVGGSIVVLIGLFLVLAARKRRQAEQS
jgi:hypothetical protein